MNKKLLFGSLSSDASQDVCKLGCIGSPCVHRPAPAMIKKMAEQFPAPWISSFSVQQLKEHYDDVVGAVHFGLQHPGVEYWIVPFDKLDSVYPVTRGYMYDIIVKVRMLLLIEKASADMPEVFDIDDGSISDFGPQLVPPVTEINDVPLTNPTGSIRLVRTVSAAHVKGVLDVINADGHKAIGAPMITFGQYCMKHFPAREVDFTGIVEPGGKFWDVLGFWYDSYRGKYRNGSAAVYDGLPGVPFPPGYDPPHTRWDGRQRKITASVRAVD